MKDNIKNIKAIIISITLTIVLILTFAAILFKLEVLNPIKYTKVFEENKIYSEIYEEIHTDINKYVAYNDLPKDIFNDVISKSDVVGVVNNDIFYVVGYIKGEMNKLPVINMSAYRTRVEESLKDYVGSDVDVIREEILNEIEDKLVIIDNKTLADSQGIIKMSKYAKILDSGLVIVMLIVAVFVLCALYFPIWKRRKRRKFAWMGAAIIASGILMIIIGTVGATTGVYETVVADAPYLATVIGVVIKGLIGKFRLTGAVLLVVGLLLSSVYVKSKVKRKVDLSLKFG